MKRNSPEYAISQIVHLSREILEILRSDETERQRVHELMDRREMAVRQLTRSGNVHTNRSDSERSRLSGMLDLFETLHNEIGVELAKSADLQRKELAGATKRRRAEEGYRLLDEHNSPYL